MEMVNIDYKQARFNMVEQQVRPWNVLDFTVLDILNQVPREDFVPEAYRNLAYSDIAIPIGHDEEMLHPKYQGRILQELQIKPTDIALEVGTGTGYLTALMAKMAEHVYSVDIEPDFLKTAALNLSKQNIINVTLEEGDASRGWTDHGPYDVIAVTGSIDEVYDELKANLKVGGRLFAIVGESPTMEAMLYTRTGENTWEEVAIFETDIARLQNATKPQEFEF
jgi:protein-L-isoaspartate(D-aspartate) O-methyltransferase